MWNIDCMVKKCATNDFMVKQYEWWVTKYFIVKNMIGRL